MVVVVFVVFVVVVVVEGIAYKPSFRRGEDLLSIVMVVVK